MTIFDAGCGTGRNIVYLLREGYEVFGTERYLVDEAILTQVTNDLGAELVDPIKTTVVQNQRSMTTWVLRKR